MATATLGIRVMPIVIKYVRTLDSATLVRGANALRTETGRNSGNGGMVMRMDGSARSRVRDVKIGIEY